MKSLIFALIMFIGLIAAPCITKAADVVELQKGDNIAQENVSLNVLEVHQIMRPDKAILFQTQEQKRYWHVKNYKFYVYDPDLEHNNGAYAYNMFLLPFESFVITSINKTRNLQLESIYKLKIANAQFNYGMRNLWNNIGTLIELEMIKRGLISAAINPEVWQKYILENLFKDNSFLNYAYNADDYVFNGKIVHIQNAGNPSNVVKDRTTLPATVKRRQDISISYELSPFTSDPSFIPNADRVELSYDKMASVLNTDMAILKEKVAEWMLYNWRATESDRIIRTTGGSVAAHLSSATGNRKLLLAADLKRARKLMNKLNIPAEGRFAMIDSDMYDQLTNDANFTSNRDAIRELNLPEGTINRLYGFNIIERSSVLIANNASTPVIKDPDASGATTDNGVVLCWQQNSVERAIGQIKMFETLNDPTYYGDIYSFEVYAGGRLRYADEKGVIAIVQDAA